MSKEKTIKIYVSSEVKRSLKLAAKLANTTLEEFVKQSAYMYAMLVLDDKTEVEK